MKLAAPKLRKHIVILLQKLCERNMLYPTCYALNGIEEILPKDAGGFCDIYQGRYQGQSLCLKVVRLYQKRDQHEMLKVRNCFLLVPHVWLYVLLSGSRERSHSLEPA